MAQGQDFPGDSTSIPPPSQHPTPGGFPMLGVAETRKAPSSEGALSILVTGQQNAFSNFLKTLH